MVAGAMFCSHDTVQLVDFDWGNPHHFFVLFFPHFFFFFFFFFMIFMNYVGNAQFWYKHQWKNGESNQNNNFDLYLGQAAWNY